MITFITFCDVLFIVRELLVKVNISGLTDAFKKVLFFFNKFIWDFTTLTSTTLIFWTWIIFFF